MNRLNKTESSVFLYCWFTLFLKDQFSGLYIDTIRIHILSESLMIISKGPVVAHTNILNGEYALK